MIPQATSLFSESSVSWGCIAQCPTTSITSSFATKKGQLDPLVCRHRAVKKKTCTSFESIRPRFLHDLMDVASFTLGETLEKPCFAVTEDLLECSGKGELSTNSEDPAYYSFGLALGLARKTHCLAAVTETYPALSLTPQLAEQLLSSFETVQPGTEVLIHNMKGPWPHWLDQDIRRLPLHFFPNYVFGKVAMFNRVHFWLN